MRARTVRRRNLTIALIGLLATLMLYLLFRAAWDTFFGVVPWPGYEESARLGLIEPWFINSPRSLWFTRATFFILAFATAMVCHDHRWSAAASLWIGAAIGIAATYATTTNRLLDWGWLGYAVYPFRVLLPVLLGTVIAELLVRVRRRGIVAT
jgi:hypothetical protein